MWAEAANKFVALSLHFSELCKHGNIFPIFISLAEGVESSSGQASAADGSDHADLPSTIQPEGATQ